jgi:hypothetical protein
MTQDEVMQMMTDMGLHEGGMDNWVMDNAWYAFAKLVAAKEREACASICDDASWPQPYEIHSDSQWAAKMLAVSIRARGQA